MGKARVIQGALQVGIQLDLTLDEVEKLKLLLSNVRTAVVMNSQGKMVDQLAYLVNRVDVGANKAFYSRLQMALEAVIPMPLAEDTYDGLSPTSWDKNRDRYYWLQW